MDNRRPDRQGERSPNCPGSCLGEERDCRLGHTPPAPGMEFFSARLG